MDTYRVIANLDGTNSKKRSLEDSSTSIIDEPPPPSKIPRTRVRFTDEETRTITEEFGLTVDSSNVSLSRCREALVKHPCLKDRSAKEVQDKVRSILLALKRRNA